MNDKNGLESTDRIVLMGLGACAAVGLFVVCMFGFVLLSPSKTFVAILWALGCTAVGHLIGFIFGIPRIVIDPSPKPTSGSTTKAEPSVGPREIKSPYQVNTNLQDISDWLTKIIVGLGLVELRQVDDHMLRAATFVGQSLGSQEAPGVAGAIIVYFSTLGFLGGYLTTRLFLSAAFARADRAMTTEERERIESAEINIDEFELGVNPNTLEAARKVALIPWGSVKVSDMPVWSKAKLIVNDVRDALLGFKFLVELYPNDIRFRLYYCQALFENGEQEEAFKHANQALGLITKVTPPREVEACYKAVMFYALYIQPDGYKQTIALAEQYQQLSGKQLSAPMWVNLAAAYGQQASKDPSRRADAKENAVRASKQAIELDPAWKAKLKEMWHPAPNAMDNDLVAFKDDEDFKALLA